MQTFGAYVIGNSEPWTPRRVILGFMEDAADLARQLNGSYVGPLPFEAPVFDPTPSED
jgi:hypothetical protein